jgi:hypothetical protein
MLLGILPAFRDLRAPLIAGYVLLIAGWLALHDHVPRRQDATGSLRELYDLSSAGGRAGILAAATFAAFLLGSLTQFSAEAVSRYRNRNRGGARYDLEDDSLLRAHIQHLLADDRRLSSAAKQEPGANDLADEELEDFVVKAVSREIPRIARRMRGGENELFDEYDRLIAEAQLREITLIPLLILFVVLSATWSWFFLAAIAVLPLLKRQAVYQREDGHAVVIDAILVGKVASPALERLQRRAEATETPAVRTLSAEPPSLS